MRQFKGGQSNPTYLIETPLRALRAAPQAAGQAVAVGACRRSRVPGHQRAARTRFPGRRAGALLRRRGRHRHARSSSWPMSRAGCSGSRICRRPTSAERAQVYDAMNATLARLHNFDPAAIGLADYGRGENYVARQVERWSKQYRASETQPIEDDGAADRLAAGASAAAAATAACAWRLPARQHDRRCRCRAAILAVLDWELSTLGDPLADFSYHLMAVAHAALRSRHRLALKASILPCSAFRRLPAMSTPMWRAPASIRGRICRPISPIISSGSRRSCKALPAVCATAPRPAPSPPIKAALVAPLAAKGWEFAQQAGA